MPSTIGIIYPPPEVRSIVDKTASFVARNGPEFEEKIRQNEISNVKFNFLNPNDPYHAYYQHKVKELVESGGSSTTTKEAQAASTIAQAGGSNAPAAGPSSVSLQNNMQKMSLSVKTQDAQSRIIEQMIILKEPPPDFDFLVDAPSIMPMDIDVIKLTAQFVARNGRPFLIGIMNKEQRNPMFDFLKPQHSHFSYFTRLVDQYTKILMPSMDTLDKLRREIAQPFGVLKDVMYRVEWEKAQQRERAKEEEAAERERIAYAQIDWHDFVVVETVDYQANEVGNFPPPTTPQDVGARVVAQERMEKSGGGTEVGMSMSRILEEEAHTVEQLSELAAWQGQTADSTSKSEKVDKNVDEVAMDEDSDQEQEEQEKADQAIVTKAAPAITVAPVPDVSLPPNPDNVIIRRDYDPKQAKQRVSDSAASKAGGVGGGASGETMFKSPLTGELIPASSMSEHMRISMLDPRWLEQRQKEKKEREEKEDVLASGLNIEMNLKRLAEYRSDMFGSGAEEVLIGRKVGMSGMGVGGDDETGAGGEGGGGDGEGSIWDGHGSSMEKASKRAMSGITLEDQIRAIHTSKGLLDDPNASAAMSGGNKIGPSSAPSAASQQTIPSSNVPMIAIGAGGGGAPLVNIQPPPQPINVMSVRTPLMPTPPMPLQPLIEMSSTSDEPATKRIKTAEDNLMAESDYLTLNFGRGVFRFYVVVPNVPDKPEWNLNGQTIAIEMELTEPVSSIKNKLMEILTIPTAKQKLQLDTLFIKDTNTLAFYNVEPDTVIHLQLKERGGRKK